MTDLNRDPLRTLRDELKLKARLARMELRTEWEKLEPRLDRALSSASIVSAEVMHDLQKRAEELRARMD